MANAKTLKLKLVKDSGQISIGNWLGFIAINSGNVPVMVGRQKLDQNGDYTCKDSDGIPYAMDETLSIAFDEAAGSRELTIEYTELICC